MTTDRRFCRFSRSLTPATLGTPEVPEDGFCLSTFLVLASREHPTAVLLGRPDPGAPWEHLGAIDSGRIGAWGGGWMLPSSHLLLFEGPAEAAARVAREQLGIGPLKLESPLVISDVYTPRQNPRARRHWDLGFIFRGNLSESELKPSVPWRELRFVDTRTLDASAMVRSQEDVLAAAGFALGTGRR